MKNAMKFKSQQKESFNSTNVSRPMVENDHSFKTLNYDKPNLLDLFELLDLSNLRKSNLILYENEQQLIKLADLKCNLIDLKFQTIILNYLFDNFIRRLVKDRPNLDANSDSITCINLLFNLILEKRTVIVK
jgi:hypothetical protein